MGSVFGRSADQQTQEMAIRKNRRMKQAMHDNSVPDAIDNLTDAQLDEFKDAFKAFDSDGGGAIDHDELKALMASVGQMPSDNEVAEMIKIADADGSGTVDFNEFVTLMAHKMINDDDHERTASAFAIFDADNSGHIDAVELRAIMCNVGEPVTLEDCQTVLSQVDQDADGKVSYDEFCRVLGARATSNDPGSPGSPASNNGFTNVVSSTEHLKHVGSGAVGPASESTKGGADRGRPSGRSSPPRGGRLRGRSRDGGGKRAATPKKRRG